MDAHSHTICALTACLHSYVLLCMYVCVHGSFLCHTGCVNTRHIHTYIHTYIHIYIYIYIYIYTHTYIWMHIHTQCAHSQAAKARREEITEILNNLETMRTVLEKGNFGGINRKVQLKPLQVDADGKVCASE